jgi:hypothetical protein
MILDAHAAITLPGPAGPAFDLAVDPANFHRFMARLGPIPGVTRAAMIDGAPPVPGTRRRLEMTDGTVVEEEIVDHRRPALHAYRWVHPPAPPFSLLVRTGDATWRFTPVADGTRIDWDYRLGLTSPLAWPLARPVAWLFGRWMTRALAALATLPRP